MATIPRDKFDTDARSRMLLADWVVLLIQHQLENHYARAEALIELGLLPDQLHWIDIPYTPSNAVRESLIERHRIPTENFEIHDYHLLKRYAEYQFAREQEGHTLLEAGESRIKVCVLCSPGIANG